MKITIDFDDNVIAPSIQRHLNTGLKVQHYIQAAVLYYNKMLEVEETGSKCGFGDASRFTSYNHEVSPKHYLDLI